MSPKPLFRHIMASRLVRGVWAGYYGLVIQLGIQLIGVPILIGVWGVHDYGVWLILTAIPAYFAVSDFGMTTAATNDMLANGTRGEVDKVVRVYQALRLLVLLACMTILVSTIVLLALFGSSWLGYFSQATSGHPCLTMLLLVAYGLLTISNGVQDAGFRAADLYATGRLVLQTIFLVEQCIMFTSVMLGAGLFQAALIMALLRLTGSIVALLMLKQKVPWLANAPWTLDISELKRLTEPALASMAIPLANAMVLWGPAIVLGAALNPAVVPVYTTARTLTRVALSAMTVVSMASVQRFTVAYAGQQHDKMDRLILLNLAIVLVMLVPAAAAAALFGPWVINIWTHGKVHTPPPLVYILALSMVCGGVWVVLSNFIIAINRQSTVTYFYAFMAACGCVIGFVLSRMIGVTGMAMASLMVDLALALWTIRMATRLGLIDVSRLTAKAKDELGGIARIVRGGPGARNE